MAMFILDWQLALFGLVFAPLSIIPIVFVGRKLRAVAKERGLKGYTKLKKAELLELLGA